MIIRKEFKAEFSHMVRDCTTERCKFSIHGHSAVVEVFIKGRHLDNGGMLLDFSLFKPIIGQLIDSIDHCYLYWNKESDEFQEVIHKFSERWIELPFSPSAEYLSLFFLKLLDKVIKNTQFGNGEIGLEAYAVRFHETRTGYAESRQEDLHPSRIDLEKVVFSPAVVADWSDPDLWHHLVSGATFINETPQLDFQDIVLVEKDLEEK